MRVKRIVLMVGAVWVGFGCGGSELYRKTSASYDANHLGFEYSREVEPLALRAAVREATGAALHVISTDALESVHALECAAMFVGKLFVSCRAKWSEGDKWQRLDESRSLELHYAFMASGGAPEPSIGSYLLRAGSFSCWDEGNRASSDCEQIDQRSVMRWRPVAPLISTELIDAAGAASLPKIPDWKGYEFWYFDHVACIAPLLERPRQPKCRHGFFGFRVDTPRALATSFGNALLEANAFSSTNLTGKAHLASKAIRCLRHANQVDRCWVAMNDQG